MLFQKSFKAKMLYPFASRLHLNIHGQENSVSNYSILKFYYSNYKSV